MRRVRRSLVVGLGDAGARVAKVLKSSFQERLGCIPHVSFFAIGEEQSLESFSPAEGAALKRLGLRDFVIQTPWVHNRIPDGFESHLEGDDSQHISSRLDASLLFWRDAAGIRRTLDGVVRRLFDPAEWGAAIKAGYEPEDSTQVAVYIVASLGDPIGGGLLPDFPYLVQSLDAFVSRTHSCSTTGILLLPDTDERASAANALATLKELEHYMRVKRYDFPNFDLESRERPFVNACHLIEHTNERGFALGASEDVLAMTAQWLYRALLGPQEDTTIELRLQRASSSADIWQGELDRGILPMYSSFGIAENYAPLDDILVYYTARFGADLLGAGCILSEPAEDDVQESVSSFWKDEQDLSIESAVGRNPEQVVETTVSLDVERQNRATLLFSNAPTPGALMSPSEVPLDDLRSRIEGAVRLQEEVDFDRYKRDVRKNLTTKLLPEVGESITKNVTSLLGRSPVGALRHAEGFLGGLRDQARKAKEQLEKLAEGDNQTLEMHTRRHKEAKEDALTAFRNRPNLSRALLRFFVVLAGGLACLMAVGHIIDSSWIPGLLRRPEVFVVFQNGWAIFTLPFVFGLEYLVAGLRGWSRAGDADQIPSALGFAGLAGSAVVISAAAGWYLVRAFPQSGLGNGSPIPCWILARGFSQITAALLWAIGVYGLLHWRDLHRIRQLASEWIQRHNQLARYRAMLERVEAGILLYGHIEESAQEQLEHASELRERLEELRDKYEATASTDIKSCLSGSALKKPLARSAFIDGIYQRHIMDIRHEAAEFLRDPPRSLIGWLEGDPQTIERDISDYVSGRFRDYWRQHGISQFLTAKESPTREEIEQGLKWLVGDAGRPFWSYQGATRGTTQVLVGVGSREEEVLLLNTLSGLSGSLGAEPSFFDTGERYAIVCLSYRHGLPLHLLSTIAELEQTYSLEAAENPRLHTNAALIDSLSELQLSPNENGNRASPAPQEFKEGDPHDE